MSNVEVSLNGSQIYSAEPSAGVGLEKLAVCGLATARSRSAFLLAEAGGRQPVF